MAGRAGKERGGEREVNEGEGGGGWVGMRGGGGGMVCESCY